MKYTTDTPPELITPKGVNPAGLAMIRTEALRTYAANNANHPYEDIAKCSILILGSGRGHLLNSLLDLGTNAWGLDNGTYLNDALEQPALDRTIRANLFDLHINRVNLAFEEAPRAFNWVIDEDVLPGIDPQRETEFLQVMHYWLTPAAHHNTRNNKSNLVHFIGGTNNPNVPNARSTLEEWAKVCPGHVWIEQRLAHVTQTRIL